MNWVTGWDSQVHVAFILNYQFECRHQSVIVEYCFRKYTCSRWLQGWVKDPWTGCTTNDGLSCLVVELFFRFCVTIIQTLINFKLWITQYFFNQVWFMPYERLHTEVAGRFLCNEKSPFEIPELLKFYSSGLKCIPKMKWK